jgi:hypothetical protein
MGKHLMCVPDSPRVADTYGPAGLKVEWMPFGPGRRCRGLC